jgi:excinuclease UvrABC nuclease subunit
MQTGLPCSAPGIYRIIDHEQGIDYVGATINLLRKYREHAHNGLMQGAKEYRYASVTAELVERCKNDLAALLHLFGEIEEEKLV